jgi:hypothetical protein
MSSLSLKPPVVKPLVASPLDSTESNNKVVNVDEQARQEEARAAATQTQPNVGASVVNVLTGESLTPVEQLPPATPKQAEPQPTIDVSTLSLAELLIKVDEHVAERKRRLSEYIGKKGYNPFFAGKELDDNFKKFKSMLSAGGKYAEKDVRAKASSILNAPWTEPSVAGRKFEPVGGY